MNAPSYLEPYRRAVAANGARFDSLLWQSPHTQAVRFDALCRLRDLHHGLLCDAGCGRADLYRYLVARGIELEHYCGVEAVEELAAVARQTRAQGYQIVVADFVRQPHRLAVGADVIYFGGSLNTADDATFGEVIRRVAPAARMIAGSFLCSPQRAGSSYLFWGSLDHVRELAASLDRDVRFLTDYLDGDATFLMEPKDG